jgi:hypothetical protein
MHCSNRRADVKRFGFCKLKLRRFGSVDLLREAPHSNESPPLLVSVSGKRDFAGQTAASKRPVTFNRLSAETKPPHENPPIRRYLHDTRKSLFVWDCVVVPRGLHPPRSFFTGLRGEGDGGIAPDSGHSRDRQGAPGFDPRRTSHGQTQTSGSGGADLSFPIAAHPLPRISLADNARRDLRRQKMSVQERSSQTRAPSLQNCASGPPKNPYAMRRYRRRSRRGRTIPT